MSRLYIDPSFQTDVQKDQNPQSDKTSKVQNYLEKVASLIPGEIIAAYLVMMGLVPNINNNNQEWVKWGILILCLILTPLYLNLHSEKGKPKFIHMVISSIALMVWAYVTTGDVLLPNQFDSAFASIILVAFTLISGVIPLRI